MNQNEIFSNLKVIELASVLAGPSVGQFFAELGAEVIKIENPITKGDVTRSWKLKSESADTETSAYFAAANWGKQHLYKNLKVETQRQEVIDLIAKSDIVICSYKPGDAKRLGVDYDTLKEIHSTLIYGNITGYGEDEERTGYDAIIQAETGFMYMNGEPGTLPTKLPVAMMDLMAAHQLKEGILLALYKKATTGLGSRVDVSLFDSGIASLANQATNYLVADHLPTQMGSDHPNIVPYGTVFTTKDSKQLVLAVGSDNQFKKLCHVLKIPEMSDDTRFMTNKSRVKYRIELISILEKEIKELNRESFLDLLHAQKVPAGAINNMKDLFELEKAKKMLLDYSSGDLTGVRNVAFKIYS